MILQLSASADTYITNKIINNSFSASDANVGRAGTIDLFKLYNESSFTGSTALPYALEKTETSRALIKFDYSPIMALTTSKIDYSNSSFKVELLMFDVMGGQGTPSDFTLSVFPLARKFDEGNGRDVAAFRDIDVTNWYSSSFSGGTATMWVSGGAAATGSTATWALPTDYYASGNIDGSVSHFNFEKKQRFANGDENLVIDVTDLVSASLAGQYTNHGFRLSYSASQEDDEKTYFVKRFGSRHARNVFLQPRLRVSFDDSIIDNHKSFFFDLSGSIFLNSFERGKPAFIKSGSALLDVEGSNCLEVELKSGSFSKFISGSGHVIKGNLSNYITGVYSASFALWGGDTTVVGDNPLQTVAAYVRDSGSMTFDTYWQSTEDDHTARVGYHTGSLKIEAPVRFAFDQVPKDLGVKLTNLSPEFQFDECVRLRAFITDYNAQPKSKRIPYRLKSTVVEKAFYRVCDLMTGKVIIPFIQGNNGTRLSSDSDGMYFDFDMSSLFKGRTYTFDFKIIDSGETEVIESKAAFKVV